MEIVQHPYPASQPAFAAGALTRLSTCSEQPEQPRARRMVPPVVGEIIAKLGLRYRPSGQADLEAHAEALVLLGEDCADIPADLLDEAAREWVRESKFMPKASELRELARNVRNRARAATDFGSQRLQAHCDRLNQLNWCRGQWQVVGEGDDRRIDRAGR